MGRMPAADDPLYLTLRTPDGKDETVEVTGPPGVIRFAIGTHTRRSGIWRVWSDRGRSDVYAAVRTLAGLQKYSFHESGEWHHAFADDDDAARWAGTPTRFLDQWSRPKSAMAGWTRALAVKVPHGALSEVLNAPDDEGVLWLPEAPEGRLAVVGVAVVEVNRGWANLHALPVAAYRLANGNAVVLVYTTQEFPDEIRGALTEKLSNIPAPRGSTPAEVAERVNSAEAPRLSFFGNDADGMRVVWDLRVDGIIVNEPE